MKNEVANAPITFKEFVMVMISDVITEGTFSRQPLMLGLVFHVISIFCLHCALHKIPTWKFPDNNNSNL